MSPPLVEPTMDTWYSDLTDPRLYALVGAVSLLHAVHFAGETTGPRAELWLAASLGWLGIAVLLRRRSETARLTGRS